MNIQIFIIVLLGVLQISCKEKEECVAQKLKECSLRYKVSSDFYPSNGKELEQYCSAIKRHEECSRNNIEQCISGKKQRAIIFNRLNQFSSFHYKDLCNTTTTYSRLIIKYGKCLNQTFSESSECQTKYKLMALPKEELLTALGYSDDISRTEKVLRIRQLCCWWAEYQSCSMRTALDKCGEQAAILINEKFYKTHTKSLTLRHLTYKSCLSRDMSFRYPSCLLEEGKSIDPNTLTKALNFSALNVDDYGRTKDIELAINTNDNHTDSFGPIEAAVYDDINFSVINKPGLSQIVNLLVFLFLFYW